jgi:hypothetical protein
MPSLRSAAAEDWPVTKPAATRSLIKCITLRLAIIRTVQRSGNVLAKDLQSCVLVSLEVFLTTSMPPIQEQTDMLLPPDCARALFARSPERLATIWEAPNRSRLFERRSSAKPVWAIWYKRAQAGNRDRRGCKDVEAGGGSSTARVPPTGGGKKSGPDGERAPAD